MLSDFKEYIKSHDLFTPDQKILLGVSGGIDSVTMVHLFNEAEIRFGVAHCNFQLRGIESEEDEHFVAELASKCQVSFHHTRFETQEYAEENGISIQMAARDLRYAWFEKIRKKFNYQYIAIAHNLDDNVETFFINLIRGTGIRGISGIKNKNKYVIRPLLFASRKTITDYYKQNQFDFREDSSNNSTKYTRNKIRHEVLPLLESMNPSVKQTIIESIERFANIEEIYHSVANEKVGDITSNKDDKILIDIKKLIKLPYYKTVLFEILHPLHFSSPQISDIVSVLHSISGKTFFSQTHRLIKDRDDLIVQPIPKDKVSKTYIDSSTKEIFNPISLKIKTLEIGDGFKIPQEGSVACLDFENIEFPLILRKWNSGDYFMPLGMQNLKKLSDFFIDNKYSIADKEEAWILESGNKIVWIVGKRIDDRFKITGTTSRVLQIEFDPTQPKYSFE